MSPSGRHSAPNTQQEEEEIVPLPTTESRQPDDASKYKETS